MAGPTPRSIRRGGWVTLYIANMVLYLCSESAGFITGENTCIDGGMTRQMVYHGDCGWSLEQS